MFRGSPRPGGQMMVYLNLVKGLDKIGVPYRVNRFDYIKKHSKELACIIGKPQVLFDNEWKNPVLFGASVFSHPIDCPDLFEKYPVRKILVPGEWMRKMCEPYYSNDVQAWPVGIDTDYWKPTSITKDIDILIYDKVRWNHSLYEADLIIPIRRSLQESRVSFEDIRYGHYNPEQLFHKVQRAKAAIFLCEHETQGLAYQQILAAGVPILAWDRGGYWQDPSYYPHKVKYQEVSSVPYWDERCGMKFKNIREFPAVFEAFWEKMRSDQFAPREYIMENLTLEKCANTYIDIVNSVQT
jgi:glycosyltransferase involved in cell wall biosynthesis